MRLGKAYACITGDHAGKILVFIQENKQKQYGFLSTPTMENLWIPKEQFDFALKNGIIEYIERVPRYVRNTSKAQFIENEKTAD